MNNPSSPGSLALAMIASLIACSGLPANAEHYCPDYSQMSNILKEGESRVGTPGKAPHMMRPAEIRRVLWDFVPEEKKEVIPQKGPTEQQRLELANKTVADLLKKNRIAAALGHCQKNLKELNKVTSKNIKPLEGLIKRLDLIVNRLKSRRGAENSLARARSMQATARNRIARIECLALAEKLDSTGFKLEKQGDARMAGKMYSSAAQIRSKFLGKKNRQTAWTLVSLARARANHGDFESAKKSYRKAIAIYRSHPTKDDAELKTALEGLAQVMHKTNNQAAAEKIYDQIRRLN